MSFVNVMVAGKVRSYPEKIAEFGDFVAECGWPQSIADFRREVAEPTFHVGSWIVAAYGWVVIDDSGVAYQIEMRRTGSYTITGAAPMVRHQDVYYA